MSRYTLKNISIEKRAFPVLLSYGGSWSMFLIRWIRCLFCKHAWKFDEVLPSPFGIVLAKSRCVKCGKERIKKWGI